MCSSSGSSERAAFVRCAVWILRADALGATGTPHHCHHHLCALDSRHDYQTISPLARMTLEKAARERTKPVRHRLSTLPPCLLTIIPSPSLSLSLSFPVCWPSFSLCLSLPLSRSLPLSLSLSLSLSLNGADHCVVFAQSCPLATL